MIYKLALLLLIISLFSCDSNNRNIVNIDNKTNITAEEIDSSIGIQLYLLRQQATNDIINKKIFKSIIKEKKYDGKKHSKERLLQIIDSLRKVLTINNKFYELYGRYLSQDSLERFALNNATNKETKVDFILNSDCKHCAELYPEIKKLVLKYDKTINFNIVFYINKRDTTAAVCLTNISIPKKIELLDYIYLQKVYFKNKINWTNKEIATNLCKLDRTRQYLQKNYIYATPTIIVNGLIIDDPYCITILNTMLTKK